MKLYYYHNRFAHAQRNAAGLDYTPAYLPALIKNLGFSAEELYPSDVSLLKAGDMLIIGAEALSESETTALSAAIDRGCGVIAFGARAENVFPEVVTGVYSEDQYATVGYFHFTDSDELLPVLGRFDTMPIVDHALGSIITKENVAVHTVYAKLSDKVWYWSFDLPATLLYAADGRPTYGPKNNFPVPVGRVPDSCVLEENYDYNIAYADSYLRSVEDILSDAGFVRIWALPEQNGKICDLALYFAGDDDAYSAENDLRAAEAMYKLGLPYHLNLMPVGLEERFVIDRDQYKRLHELNCETAIHYNFTAYPFSQEGHRMQMDMYERIFGETSGGPVNHCLVQEGTAAERYRMQVECGAKSDNNRFQNQLDPADINAFNLTGFAFGSAFPRFVICDAEHGNRELPFCEIYGSYYEPRIYECKPEEYKKIEDYLENGYIYGRPLQLFTHPHYISGAAGFDPKPALRSLEHAKAYVTEKGWNVWYCGPDALGDWWHERSSCTITETTSNGFVLHNPTSRRVTAVLPPGVSQIVINGQRMPVTAKTVAGRFLTMISLGSGRSEITYL